VSVIDVQNVWKRFRIPHEKRYTILDHLAGILPSITGKSSFEEFWALKEVQVGLERGESLGIIGPNGSGKSTLLKLLACVMKPDKGSIKTNGSIAPVLELGIGFNGDLTVKENAQVYGILMGLSRVQMKKLIKPIISFAELERFEDTKLKHLSSGMQVRLALSIALETSADIFLVDEALAGGDMEFQEKCLDRFREFKKEDKTIVLVSHNMGLIEDFCERSLYLLKGEVKAFGESNEIIQKYLDDVNQGIHQQNPTSYPT
jgi:lipopolysaccharide transport system ATP-binding protein